MSETPKVPVSETPKVPVSKTRKVPVSKIPKVPASKIPSAADARELFALYHLGLDSKRQHAFRNLPDVARIHATDSATVLRWLKEARIDPDTVGTVDFNISALHVDAMFLADTNIEDFIDKAWHGYRTALKDAQPGQFFYDHDYDNL